jgi:nucleoside diphosphate kinase
MADNFNSFKKLAGNQSPEDAAKNTFTGKMASDYGFNNVRIVTNNNAAVVVEFTR